MTGKKVETQVDDNLAEELNNLFKEKSESAKLSKDKEESLNSLSSSSEEEEPMKNRKDQPSVHIPGPFRLVLNSMWNPYSLYSNHNNYLAPLIAK